ncbi:hypothetical protein B0H10DRAFT_1959947 [Mycena sp. CBHHK59/15]|nr:hypothetical protein B0H10DRAFT_1959947 [Mycena sp. CBHHK59/15]
MSGDVDGTAGCGLRLVGIQRALLHRLSVVSSFEEHPRPTPANPARCSCIAVTALTVANPFLPSQDNGYFYPIVEIRKFMDVYLATESPQERETAVEARRAQTLAITKKIQQHKNQVVEQQFAREEKERALRTSRLQALVGLAQIKRVLLMMAQPRAAITRSISAAIGKYSAFWDAKGDPRRPPLMLAAGPAARSFPLAAEAHCVVLHMFFCVIVAKLTTLGWSDEPWMARSLSDEVSSCPSVNLNMGFTPTLLLTHCQYISMDLERAKWRYFTQSRLSTFQRTFPPIIDLDKLDLSVRPNLTDIAMLPEVCAPLDLDGEDAVVEDDLITALKPTMPQLLVAWSDNALARLRAHVHEQLGLGAARQG